MSQEKKRTRLNLIYVGPSLAKLVAGELSGGVDAANDRKWFEQNPGGDKRERPASPLELKVTGYPPGTRVLVVLGPFGTQMRCFLEDN